MSDESELRVRVNEIFYQRLERIKSYYGVKNDAEMIRVLVSEKYHEIEKEKTK